MTFLANGDKMPGFGRIKSQDSTDPIEIYIRDHSLRLTAVQERLLKVRLFYSFFAQPSWLSTTRTLSGLSKLVKKTVEFTTGDMNPQPTATEAFLNYI